MPDPTELTESKQLLVEGNDAQRFFGALLRHLGITDVQIQNFGGVEQLRRFLKALLITPNFSGSVRSVGIVRDAETSAASAAQSVRDALGAAGLAMPPAAASPVGGSPQVSYFILPDNTQAGMLETLCLLAVSADPVMPCVYDFFNCTTARGITPSNMEKARIQAFLASRHELRRLLGEAADAGYWPWDDPAFTEIKQFVRAI